MDKPFFRKPRQHFDIATRPSHVTFDDGEKRRSNFPWIHFVEATWEYAEPETIKVIMGDWLVVITGHNLASLYLAIEEGTLARLRAQPELTRDAERDADTFATEIRFLKVPPPVRRGGQTELELGLN
jgi:hypothetical protein